MILRLENSSLTRQLQHPGVYRTDYFGILNELPRRIRRTTADRIQMRLEPKSGLPDLIVRNVIILFPSRWIQVSFEEEDAMRAKKIIIAKCCVLERRGNFERRRSSSQRL